jgi:stage II sporulation protein D (peptidoglycan lytic transglycosylase)
VLSFWPVLLPLAGQAAGVDTRVRVLLLETPGSVRVAGMQLAPGAEGVWLGQRNLGRHWQLAGAGPHRVDDFEVRGGVEVERTERGLRVVNRVPLEDYVAGTLGNELYPDWEAETYKAQAVAARTFALYQRARRSGEPFDVSAETGDQVYRGVGAETPAAHAAVAATRGEVLTYDGAPILAAFHSASGGRTASAEEVWGQAHAYLVSRLVPDEEDSPDTYWRASISGTTLGRALAPLGLRLGSVREVRVVERTESGRARRVRIVGTEGSEDMTGRALRSALGMSVIRSTLFEVHDLAGRFVFVGSGNGHGVGMSQWGAEAMAKRGASYRDILAWFYPGTQLVRSDAQ